MTVRRAYVPNATLDTAELLAALAQPLDLDGAERTVARLTAAASAVLFESARGAIAAAVAVLAPGGRVAVPGYTCISVTNAVLYGGAELVYADVDGRGLVPAKGWPDCQLVLAQDTYGFPSDLPSRPVVVRDASHRADLMRTAGARVAITSFGESKSLTVGRGGVAVSDDRELADRMRRWRDRQTPARKRLRDGAVALRKVLTGRLEYRGAGAPVDSLRRIRRAMAPIRAAGPSTELAAYRAGPPLLGRPDGTVARLITTQLRRQAVVAEHRASIVALYDRVTGVDRPAVPLVRYPMAVDDPGAAERQFRSAGWDIADRWFNAPLHPSAAEPTDFGYEPGSAPNGERLAATVVNLPTHPLVQKDDAAELIDCAVAVGAEPLR